MHVPTRALETLASELERVVSDLDGRRVVSGEC